MAGNGGGVGGVLRFKARQDGRGHHVPGPHSGGSGGVEGEGLEVAGVEEAKFAVKAGGSHDVEIHMCLGSEVENGAIFGDQGPFVAIDPAVETGVVMEQDHSGRTGDFGEQEGKTGDADRERLCMLDDLQGFGDVGIGGKNDAIFAGDRVEAFRDLNFGTFGKDDDITVTLSAKSGHEDIKLPIGKGFATRFGRKITPTVVNDIVLPAWGGCTSADVAQQKVAKAAREL